jgi:hypothetical protein
MERSQPNKPLKLLMPEPLLHLDADTVLILLSADTETVIKALYQDLDRSPKLLDFGLYVCPVVWG